MANERGQLRVLADIDRAGWHHPCACWGVLAATAPAVVAAGLEPFAARQLAGIISLKRHPKQVAAADHLRCYGIDVSEFYVHGPQLGVGGRPCVCTAPVTRADGRS